MVLELEHVQSLAWVVLDAGISYLGALRYMGLGEGRRRARRRPGGRGSLQRAVSGGTSRVCHGLARCAAAVYTVSGRLTDSLASWRRLYGDGGSSAMGACGCGASSGVSVQ
jgi:hypothetical protein